MTDRQTDRKKEEDLQVERQTGKQIDGEMSAKIVSKCEDCRKFVSANENFKPPRPITRACFI